MPRAEEGLLAQVPAHALDALAVLEGAGHEAWVVGGWVRDALRGETGHDVDVATSARWQETAEAFRAAGMTVHETGTDHGTVTCIVDGEPVEVTTYRVDGAYSDGRHPDSVAFVDDIVEDLARRDLTVNAMAWHPERGLLDPFGGRDDLAAGTIRAVGDPDARMAEDALRVLRAVRFAARLGFAVEPATQQALDAHATDLASVSRERVGEEMRALLMTGRGGEALRTQKRVLFAAVPELAPMDGFPQKTPYHSLDVLDHVARVMDYVQVFAGGVVSEPLAWAALLHDVGKPHCLTYGEDGRAHFYGHPSKGRDIARAVMGRLAVPHAVQVPALALVRLHDRPVADTDASVRSILRDLEGLAPGRAVPLAHQLMVIKRADAMGKAPAYRDYAVEVDRLEGRLRSVTARRDPYSVSSLPVNGADVMEVLSLKPGPAVGEALDGLLDAVVSGVVPPEREPLLKYLASTGASGDLS